VAVNRGPSLAAASAGIAAAVVADIEARQERNAAYWRWHEEAVRAAERHPLKAVPSSRSEGSAALSTAIAIARSNAR
jgi:hypothetical protein